MSTRRFFVTFLAVAAALSLLGSYALLSGAPVARSMPSVSARAVRGAATIQLHAASSSEPLGMVSALAAGDEITTGPDALALVAAFDAFRIVLGPQSSLRTLVVLQHPELRGSSRAGFALTAGRAFVAWNNENPDNRYVIETADARAAGPLGAASSLLIAADGRTVFTALSGAPARLGVVVREPGGSTIRELSPLALMQFAAVYGGRATGRRQVAPGELARDEFFSDANGILSAEALRDRETATSDLRALAGRVFPGQLAYAIKRLGEELRIAFTGDATARENARFAMLERRLAEELLRGSAAAHRGFDRALARLREDAMRLDTIPRDARLSRLESFERAEPIYWKNRLGQAGVGLRTTRDPAAAVFDATVLYYPPVPPAPSVAALATSTSPIAEPASTTPIIDLTTPAPMVP